MRAIAGILLVALSLPAAADQVCLSNGRCVEGRIVEQTATRVVVEVGAGRVGFPRSQVVSLRQASSALDTFEERASRLEPGDAAGWLELGFWARDRQLETRARAAFERALRIDPGNGAAQRALLVEQPVPEPPRAEPSQELERQWRALDARTAELEQRAEELAESQRRDAELLRARSGARPPAREHWGWDEGDAFVSGLPGIAGPVRVPAGQALPTCWICPTCPHPGGRHEHAWHAEPPPAAPGPPAPAAAERPRRAGIASPRH